MTRAARLHTWALAGACTAAWDRTLCLCRSRPFSACSFASSRWRWYPRPCRRLTMRQWWWGPRATVGWSTRGGARDDLNMRCRRCRCHALGVKVAYSDLFGRNIYVFGALCQNWSYYFANMRPVLFVASVVDLIGPDPPFSSLLSPPSTPHTPLLGRPLK